MSRASEPEAQHGEKEPILSMAILIKRYANRKLYNTDTSRYITLKGISELIEAGHEIRVIDNETGEDITSVALSQILVDDQKQQRHRALRACCHDAGETELLAEDSDGVARLGLQVGPSTAGT